MALKIVRHGEFIDPLLSGAVIAVAQFDGVHRGHRRVIEEAACAAALLGAPLGVLSIELESEHQEPWRLASRARQARILESLGVDFLYILPLKPVGAAEIRRTLLRRLDVLHAIVDPALAAMIEGGLSALKSFGLSMALAETAEPDMSDAIRAALRSGRTDLAAQMLGRPFAIEGMVVEGQQLGRLLGYPTANVAAGHYVRPRLGVYATRSRLPDGRVLPGVANFGANPTTGLVEPRLETWLFDFDEDIYGQVLDTDLVAFLRPEQKFDGLPSLIEQIGKDADTARSVLFAAHAPLALAG